jgi:uncharacterized protein YjiS (DUF1127 family)
MLHRIKARRRPPQGRGAGTGPDDGTEVMNAQVKKEEIALLLPNSLTISDAEATRNASFRSSVAPRPGLFARIAGWLREMPRRHAVLEELNALSDRELADIGLTRADIGHVFDADFAHGVERGPQASRIADRTVAA